ncbi:hypothetical protein IGI04_025939, partial [Brassica rapa subsp. trilocularis]
HSLLPFLNILSSLNCPRRTADSPHELMQFSTKESDIAAAANEALKRFRDKRKKRFCSGGHGIQLPHKGEAGDDVGRRHTAHGTKRNLIQTARSLQTRTKSTFVVTRPANVTETLKKEIPVQYGGNERDDDTKFSNEADSPMKLFLKLSLSLGHL